jgi:hypothetical protein
MTRYALRRDLPEGAKLKRPRLTPERMEAIAGMIRQGMTCKQIHEACGAGHRTVRKAAKAHGLILKHGGSRKRSGAKPEAPTYKAQRRAAFRASTPIEAGQPNYRARAASLRWGDPW